MPLSIEADIINLYNVCVSVCVCVCMCVRVPVGLWNIFLILKVCNDNFDGETTGLLVK